MFKAGLELMVLGFESAHLRRKLLYDKKHIVDEIAVQISHAMASRKLHLERVIPIFSTFAKYYSQEELLLSKSHLDFLPAMSSKKNCFPSSSQLEESDKLLVKNPSFQFLWRLLHQEAIMIHRAIICVQNEITVILDGKQITFLSDDDLFNDCVFEQLVARVNMLTFLCSQYLSRIFQIIAVFSQGMNMMLRQLEIHKEIYGETTKFSETINHFQD